MTAPVDLAADRLSGWAGTGGGWVAEMNFTKPSGEEWPEVAGTGVLRIRKRAGVEEKAQPGITRLRSWSRLRGVVAIPRTRSDSSTATALAMANLTGPEYPILMLVCAQQWHHLPTLQRYADACGLDPTAAMDALERILWRRAAISIDQRAKQLGIRAASYRERTRDAEAMFLRWLDRAATAFLTAHN